MRGRDALPFLRWQREQKQDRAGKLLADAAARRQLPPVCFEEWHYFLVIIRQPSEGELALRIEARHPSIAGGCK